MARIVDIHTYMPMLIELINKGHDVNFIVTGTSMTPFLINGRDTVIISPITSSLKRGDIVFFQRQNGQYVMHRIVKVKKDGFYLVGDHQTIIEGPISRSQIFGIIHTVIRKGATITEGDFVWWLFAHVWLSVIPLRKIVLKLYNLIHPVNDGASH